MNGKFVSMVQKIQSLTNLIIACLMVFHVQENILSRRNKDIVNQSSDSDVVVNFV